jgi:2-polyprenyl-3-methyl-5-hydroxy-6-metoxy-1,4-benzoquinol methylase
MRKDYVIADVNKDQRQTEFVRKYWEKIWKELKEPDPSSQPLERKEQYRIMRPFLESFPEGAKLLDAGCGLGEWTVQLHQKGYDVQGMDLASETIKRLRNIFPDINFTTGDIRNTKLGSETFDCIFSWGVFEHFEEGLQPCIKEAHRLLKPGGLLFVSVPYDNFRHSLRSVRDRGLGKFADKKMRFYQWRFTRQELRLELSRADFNVLSIEHICKRDGLLRCLYHEFRLNHKWFLTKALSVALQPLFPGWLISHMILGVSRKPERMKD